MAYFKILRSAGPIAAGTVLSAGVANAQQASHAVVPIREVVIRPLGTPRFAVSILVNGVPVETGLDTGSVGLRVLPAVTRRARIAGQGPAARYSYGSGVELNGHRADATVRIGAVGGPVSLQAVDEVGCAAGRECPADRVSPDAYGLMGSGQPGQGFQAIMGIRLNTGDIPNPLVALGVHRWIVHLSPRGGGVLVLNPDPRETAGFVALRSGDGPSGTVAGCVMVDRPDARQLCGPTLLDTGQPQIVVRGADRPPAWDRGVAARLAMPAAADAAAPSVVFRTGDPMVGTLTDFMPAAGGGVSLNAGRLPFYAYDVLFDADRGTVSVRPNPDAPAAARPVPR